MGNKRIALQPLKPNSHCQQQKHYSTRLGGGCLQYSMSVGGYLQWPLRGSMLLRAYQCDLHSCGLLECHLHFCVVQLQLDVVSAKTEHLKVLTDVKIRTRYVI